MSVPYITLEKIRVQSIPRGKNQEFMISIRCTRHADQDRRFRCKRGGRISCVLCSAWRTGQLGISGMDTPEQQQNRKLSVFPVLGLQHCDLQCMRGGRSTIVSSCDEIRPDSLTRYSIPTHIELLV